MLHSPSRLSWSSVSTYADCGEKWRLTRGHRVTESTWFATVAGSVIHKLTELYDTGDLVLGVDGSDVDKVFKAEFDKALLNEKREVKPSGKIAKSITDYGGPNKKDYHWWLDKGPEYVREYVKWRSLNPDWKIATLAGDIPGIEVEFHVKFNNELVLGYIDRVFEVDGQLVVVDLKTGNEPTGALQLATYKVGLEEQYGVSVDLGYYWLPYSKDGGARLSMAHNLTEYSSEYVKHMYSMARTGIEAGVFIPSVSAMCKGCTVKDYCRAVAGDKKREVPMITEFAPRGPELDEDGLPIFDLKEEE